MDLYEKYNNFIKFDQTQIEDRLQKIPSMIGYYQDMYHTVRKKHTKYGFELDRKWTERFLYYRNEYKIALNNNEIKSFVEKDLEYMEIRKKLAEVDDILSQLEMTLKSLDNMGWTLKNLIEWKKFQAGMLS